MDEDDTFDCKECLQPMEDMPAIYAGRLRPQKTYQCPNPHCRRRLLVFYATPRPLRLSNNNFGGEMKFAEFVEKMAKEKGLTLTPQSWPELLPPSP